MTDYIAIVFKQAAVALADAQSYEGAAARLGIASTELRHRIDELEAKLCLNLFAPQSEPPEVTAEGQFLIQAFREALIRREQS